MSTTNATNGKKKITSFSDAVIDALGVYVYALVDPRDNKIFYVGKGRGNRVFQHAQEAEASDFTQTASEKIQQILDILNDEKDVKCYILRHHLEATNADEVGFTIESTIIDLLNSGLVSVDFNLTNGQTGHQQYEYGIMTVDEIIQKYDPLPELRRRNGDELVAVKLNKVYRKDITPDELYEGTRRSWVMSLDRAKKITHVLGVYLGRVVSVVKVTDAAKDTDNSKRVIFTGELIDDKDYLNKSVAEYTKCQNPVTYLEKISELKDKAVCVSLAQSYELAMSNNDSLSLYDAVRGNWLMDFEKAKTMNLVLGVFKNEIVAVLKVESCSQVESGRVAFTGKLLEDSKYLGVATGQLFYGSAVRYLDTDKLI